MTTYVHSRGLYIVLDKVRTGFPRVCEACPRWAEINGSQSAIRIDTIDMSTYSRANRFGCVLMCDGGMTPDQRWVRACVTK